MGGEVISGTNAFEEEPKPRTLPTAAVADACLRLGIELRMAPPGIQPVVPGACVAGRARPARHYGSVDVFLEAIEGAAAGDILVIDNGGRRDEACIGDLVTLEAQSSGVAALVVWGAHRDSVELRRIGLPVFSYGLCLAGPRRLDRTEPDALLSARFGDITVTRADMVVADDDGLLFVPAVRWEEILQVARKIILREREQAAAANHGNTLRQQFRFAEYLARRATDAAYTFRLHLRQVEGAIEE